MKKILLSIITIISFSFASNETFKVGSLDIDFALDRDIYTTCLNNKVYYIISDGHQGGIAPKIKDNKALECTLNNLREYVSISKPKKLGKLDIPFALDRNYYKVYINEIPYYIISDGYQAGITPVF